MTPMQRFRAAVEGAPVDHLPATCWLHFASDHLDGEETAALHEKFVRTYEWDVVKVMGDYRYPVPSDLRGIRQSSDLDRIEAASLDHDSFAQQLRCLRSLQQRLGPDIPLLDTGFDPYQSIIRNLGRDQQPVLWEHRQATLRALERVCESICAYVREIKRMGVTGYFYSMNSCIPEGFPRGTSQQEYETFLRPFDLRVLEAAEGMVRVLHVHGSGLDLSRLEGYPFEVINLSDRAPSNPSVARLRDFTSRCVMGGIDEGTLPDLSLGALGAQMEDALAQAGRRGFIMAPGCAVPSYSPRRSLRFFREHSRRL